MNKKMDLTSKSGEMFVEPVGLGIEAGPVCKLDLTLRQKRIQLKLTGDIVGQNKHLNKATL